MPKKFTPKKSVKAPAIQGGGGRDKSKLVRKEITDKTGKKTHVWVRMGKEVGEKAKKKVQEWTEKQKGEYDPHEGAGFLRKKWKGLLKGLKHEVQEWKEAGSGMKKLFSGEKPSEHEAKAMKTVAIHLGIVTAIAMTSPMSGGALAVAGKLGAKIGLGYLEHAGLMRAGHALLFAKAEEGELSEEGNEGEDMHDWEAEAHLKHMIMDMARYVEQKAHEAGHEPPKQKEEKEEEPKKEAKKQPKEDSEEEEGMNPNPFEGQIDMPKEETD